MLCLEKCLDKTTCHASRCEAEARHRNRKSASRERHHWPSKPSIAKLPGTVAGGGTRSPPALRFSCISPGGGHSGERCQPVHFTSPVPLAVKKRPRDWGSLVDDGTGPSPMAATALGVSSSTHATNPHGPGSSHVPMPRPSPRTTEPLLRRDAHSDTASLARRGYYTKGSCRLLPVPGAL